VARLRFNITMSLDGYTAGPNQGVDNPLGERGEDLHGWVVATRSWRASHGKEGGEGGIDDERAAHWTSGFGATIMGRKMFGPIRGAWPDEDWRGWWGEDPPFHHPVFVLTHHARDPVEMQGGTTFHFVTGGIEAALERAMEAAGGKDVNIGGGAATGQQYMRARLVDEFEVHVVPVLLGGGERLFDDLAGGRGGYECVAISSSPAVAHFQYAKTDA
jgi:dihydrofolate reductase